MQAGSEGRPLGFGILLRVETTSNLIIAIASGLLAYWWYRVRTLLGRDDEEIEAVLEHDIWWGRQFLLALRSYFDPTPFQLP
jgi:hypothetical protein